MGGPVVVDDGSRAVVLVVRDGVEIVLFRVDPWARPDLSMVDVLARLHLAARRFGWTIRLQNPCPRLCEVLELIGLDEVFGLRPLRVEALGQPEGREQLRVQERVQGGDPPL